MTDSVSQLIAWCPRVLGILCALFLAVFAADSLGEGPIPLLLHLVPTGILLLVVALAWRRPWVGGIAFIGLAALYTVTTLHRPDWILTIAGPLYVVGALFLISWRFQSG